jgi:hypothetical protein
VPGDLIARVEEGVSVDAEEGERVVAPDVHVAEQEPFAYLEPAASNVAVAEPLVVPADDYGVQRHIAILDASDGNRVVTVIEFLSPTNKLRGDGRERYKLKQQQYLASDVNLVEVDLVRAGEFTVAVGNDEFAARGDAPYYVCVRRRTRRWEAEIYPIGLRDPLPTFRVPLRPRDRDVTLDLQTLLRQCYDRGRYAASLDYSRQPSPPLASDEERDWASGLLAGR